MGGWFLKFKIALDLIGIEVWGAVVLGLFLKGLSAIASFVNGGVGESKAATHEIFGKVDAEIVELGEFGFVDEDVDIAAGEEAIAGGGFGVEGEVVDEVETPTWDGLQAHVFGWFSVVPLDAFNFLGCGG